MHTSRLAKTTPKPLARRSLMLGEGRAKRKCTSSCKKPPDNHPTSENAADAAQQTAVAFPRQREVR